MEITTNSTSSSKLNLAMILVFLAAPYYYIRYGVFDFSKGTSFYIADFFLISACLLISVKTLQNLKSIFQNKQLLHILVAGGVFVSLCLLSGVTAKISGANNNVNWTTLLSGTIQYGFILLALPIVAFFYISQNNLRTAIRYIAIGYLPPMIINILLAPEEAFPYLREMFFCANRALGTYGNANSLAEVLLITVPFYVYLVATETGFWKKIGYIGLVAFLDCLFLSGSFSGFLTLIAITLANIALIAFWKNHPLRPHIKNIVKQTALIASIFICSYLLLSLYAPYVVGKVNERIIPQKEQQIEQTALEQTVNTRMELNYRGLELLKQRSGGLFYGHGLRQTANLPEFNFGGNGLDIHLIYLLLWVEGGFILGATFGIYSLLLLRNCFNLAKTHPAEAITLATAVLSMVLFGLFLPHNYLRYLWIPLIPAFITIKNE